MSTGSMDSATSLPPVSATAGPASAGLEARLDQIQRLLEEQEARRQDLEEIVADLMPAVNGVLRQASTRLHELEQSGALELLPLAGGAVAALQRPSTLVPLGPWRLFRALRDPQVARGLAVVIELVRALGQAGQPENA